MTDIQINRQGRNLEEVFSGDLCTVEIFENIYEIFLKGANTGWMVKTYQNTRYATIEVENLKKIEWISGTPKLLTYRVEKDFSYVIISQAKGVDLRDYMEQTGLFSETEVKPIVKRVLEILVNIHRVGVIHHDIKPENVIYDPETGDITLIDYEGKQTKDYQSPEQLARRNITSKTDLWSLGIMIYDLTKNKLPFSGEKETMEKELWFSRRWSPDFVDFLYCLLERDPNARYSAEEALNHIWFQ